MTMIQQTELTVKTIDSSTWENPCGLDGCDFIEFAAHDAKPMHEVFKKLGFILKGKHKTKEIYFYEQGEIKLLINEEDKSFARDFRESHGPCVCAVGLKSEDANKAFKTAVKRGAIPYVNERKDASGHNAIYGIGNALVYLVDYNDGFPFNKDFNFNTNHQTKDSGLKDSGLKDLELNTNHQTKDSGLKDSGLKDLELNTNHQTKDFGLKYIDHITSNVPASEMQKWCDFHEKIFNFKETRFFNIKGKQTGLISKVMSSPCQKFTIPINEPTDQKSQIQEYLDEYKGPGIQHIALGTDDIITTVSKMREQKIEFLNVPDTYYDTLSERLPNITENIEDLKRLKILADGDKDGYLLQIFTKNLFGPIFIEIIQRKKHDGFGEGNFQALFDAIERDQKERGVL